ncbi:odorant receptor 22c [Harpegnathos saltator]|uniref:odorant receptor 22c n=1 Tax=Harpegnathos saltator TaxID=610380 RepID=UPI000DBEE51B|nr:odorant receptor 22c [Harpegnathos saltator]
MDRRWNRYYGVVEKVSSLAGQWPYQRRRMRIFSLSIVTLSIFSVIVSQIAKMVECDGDRQCLFPTVAAYMLSSIALVKMYTCHLSSRKIRNLTDHLLVDWDLLKSPEEYEIMKSYAENGRWYSLGYTLYCLISLCLFLSMSLIPHFLDVVLPLNESRPLVMPHPAYYFVDDREYFYYIFWYSTLTWEITVLGVIAHDCLLVTYIEHVCGIFAIVGVNTRRFRFERLSCERSEPATNVRARPEVSYHKRIMFSVQAHRRAICFAQLLEDTFSLTLALQIAIITVLMSITLLQITLQVNDVIELIRYILYVVAQLIHLFCLSFEGQKLMDHSLQTREKIYNSPWYEVPVKTQKMLLFMMRRSIQPSFMSAGIYIFSMENFSKILQTSMSYFTVLASME